MQGIQETARLSVNAVWAVAVMAVILGLLICFFGYRLLKLWVALMGCSLGFFAGFLGSRAFLDQIWVCIGIGLVMAVLLAWAAFRYHLAAVCLTCAALMFVVTYTLFRADVWWVYLICGLSAVAAGFLGVIFAKPMLIVVTGLAGAFLSVNRVFFLAGLGEGVLWIVLSAGLAAAGIAVQFLVTGKCEKEAQKNREEDSRSAETVHYHNGEDMGVQAQRQRHERRREHRQRQ